MTQNKLSELSDDKLIKRRDLLKGVSIGFGTILILVIAVFIYLIASKGLKEIPIAALIPVFALPATFTPVLMSLVLLNKEVKSRNLK